MVSCSRKLKLKLLCAFKLKQDNNTFLHAASHKTVRNHCWHIHKGYMHFTGYWMYWMYSTLSLIDLLQCISVETRPQPFSMKLLYAPDPVGLMRRRSLHWTSRISCIQQRQKEKINQKGKEIEIILKYIKKIMKKFCTHTHAKGLTGTLLIVRELWSWCTASV